MKNPFSGSSWKSKTRLQPTKLTPTTVFIFHNVSSWGGAFERWDWGEPAEVAGFLLHVCIPSLISGQFSEEDQGGEQEEAAQVEFAPIFKALEALEGKSAKQVSATLSRLVPQAGGMFSFGEPQVSMVFYPSVTDVGEVVLQRTEVEEVGALLATQGLLKRGDVGDGEKVERVWARFLSGKEKPGKAGPVLRKLLKSMCDDSE